MYTFRDIYIYIGHCMFEKFGSSSRYTYISGLYCGLGIYWVELSIIYFIILFLPFYLETCSLNKLFCSLNLLLIALLILWLTYCHLLSTLFYWGLYICLTYSINLSLRYQLHIILSPHLPLYVVVLIGRIQRFATQRLGLFEEVLTPFCLEQEYIFLWGQGRDVSLVAAVGSLSHYG